MILGEWNPKTFGNQRDYSLKGPSIPPLSESTAFDVLLADCRRLPPKALFGLASRRGHAVP